MRPLLKISLRASLAAVIASASGSAIALDTKAWEDLTNIATKERYIPVELWAGAQWDGKKELKMPKVDGTYRHRRATYQIKGPMEWEHPTMERKFLVYERINPGKDGVKWQLFTINQDQNGLGRLYDGRPGRDGRLSSGGLKFPLGLWKEGETRRFVYQVWQSKEAERVESITIQQIDFVFQGNSHCLDFYWTATSRNGGTIYDRQTYIYCPEKSMVSQTQH
ncbi:MAG TPA: hypothetical protein VFU31_02910 [Candidatus Binatia bacterium]|nr:hypothetical protein [Candidatus Binatia bacterium]